MNRLLVLPVFAILTCCFNDDHRLVSQLSHSSADSVTVVSEITVPSGYKRVDLPKQSFGDWLRNISLKKDKHVYLFNGSLKRNQTAQFAVLNISVGNKDLQQCADALMRLRAEYLFSQKRYSEIEFRDNSNKSYKCTGGADRSAFDKYLEKVFSMCGSASLEKQLEPVTNLHNMQPGDVFIKGGFPGHAMMVMDMAVNANGNKVFMLAQSYMPAQDIHIVKNPSDASFSPWYEIDDVNTIVTPEWTFLNSQLRRW